MSEQPLTDEELAEIEARCEAATPGPWEWSSIFEGDNSAHYLSVIWSEDDLGRGEDDIILDCFCEICEPSDEGAEMHSCHKMPSATDAAFISNARQDIPALLAEVRRLRKQLVTLVRLGQDQFVELVRDHGELFKPLLEDIVIEALTKKGLLPPSATSVGEQV